MATVVHQNQTQEVHLDRAGEYDVFISYSRKEKAFAEKLRAALTAQQYRVWFDIDCIPLTVNWRQEMRRGIDASHNFVFIISSNSIISGPCKEEIDHAVSQQKRLVPIVYEGVDSPKVHPELRDLNFVRFDINEFDHAYGALSDALKQDYEYIRGHTRFLQRVHDWQNKDFEKSFLLRGLDLEEAELWLSEAINKQPKPTPLQTEYITQSRQEQQRSKQAEIEREKHTRQRISRALFLTMILFITSSILGIHAHSQKQKADRAELASRLTTLDANLKRRIAVFSEIEARIAEDWTRRAKEQAQQARSLAEERRREAELAQAQAEAAEAVAQEERRNAELAKDAETEQRRLAEAREREARRNALQAEHNLVASLASLAKAQLLEQYQLDALLSAAEGALNLVSLKQEKDYTAFQNELPTATTIQVGASLQEVLANAREINRFAQHQDRVMSISYSSDGTHIASGGGKQDKQLVVWEASTGQIAWQKRHDSEIRSVRFSSDDQYIASADGSGVINLWTLGGDIYRRFTLTQGDDNQGVASMDLQRNTLVAASRQGQITAWNWRTGENLATVTVGEVRLTKIHLSADGKTLATAGFRGQQAWAQTWQIRSDRITPVEVLDTGLIGDQADQKRNITELAISPDGDWIASGEESGQIIIWHRSGQRLVKRLRANGATLGQRITDFGFNPNGTSLIIAHGDGGVTQIDLPRPTAGGTLESGVRIQEQTLRLSPVGITAIGVGPNHHLVTAGEDFTLRQWYVPPEENLHDFTVASVAVDDSGKRFASSGFDGTVKLWQGETRQLIGQFSTGEEVKALRFQPRRAMLGVVGGHGSLQLWRGTELVAESQVFPEGASGLDFSPNGRELAIADNINGTIQRMSLREDRLFKVGQAITHTGGVNCLRYSPDSRRLVSAGWDYNVKIWNTDTGQLLRTLKDLSLKDKTSHSSGVNCIAFNRDGTLLASVSVDHTLKLWNFHTGQLLATVPAHRAEIKAVEFFPDDNNFLVTAGIDGALKIWSIPTMLKQESSATPVYSLSGHDQGVTSIAFSPDGQTLVSGGKDKNIRVWSFSLPRLLSQSCQRLNGFFSSDYFENYLKVQYESVYRYCQRK